MRPRKLDYDAVADLKRNGVSVTAIARAFRVSREAVYHALRSGPGPGPASSAELRELLTRIVEHAAACEDGACPLYVEARELLARGG